MLHRQLLRIGLEVQFSRQLLLHIHRKQIVLAAMMIVQRIEALEQEILAYLSESR